MSRHPVEESAESELALDREDRACPKCGGRMHVRSRSLLTLEGPLRLSVGLVQCGDERCEHMMLYNPEQECSLAMPRWGIGWDVFCWIGQRRFSRHWSVPQIRNELRDTYDLRLSADAIADHIASYQNMVAARHQHPEELATLYRDTKQIVLTIDGLGLANHFFRDLAKPALALDSTAKKKMRAKIREFRACRYPHFLVENRRFLQGTMLPPGLSRSERQLRSYHTTPHSPLSFFARSPEASERKKRGDYRLQL